MPDDPDKQCLDDSIMVDTSNARLPGWATFAAWSSAMSV
jgi:hypothetical protein